jgi:glycosyltransferase involved in cell wall biosynthesis
MKFSVITVCFNSEESIERTILSIKAQTYKNIEYIIVDGFSIDRTNEIINTYKDIVSIHISEPDNGLYDAMNKGIRLATGDVIGILNSDDIIADSLTIQKLADSIGSYDGVYGDVGFYSDSHFKNKKRHYSSKSFSKDKFSRGMMPAHPSFYVKKECYEKAGLYRTDFKIAADFDMLLRFFQLKDTSFLYVNDEIVKMRLGGVSTSNLKSNYMLNKEILKSCKDNGLKTNWFSVLSKYPEKIMGLIFK